MDEQQAETIPSDDGEPQAPWRGYATFPRRLQGLVVDSLVLFLVMLLGLGLVAAAGTVGAGGPVLVLLVVTMLLYEPVLVARTGGTVGHHVLNLRVEREDRSERLGFFPALWRAVLKGFLGLLSFFFMVLTRRHQALHDKLTHSVVVVHDLEKAQPYHYVTERPVTPGAAVGVSAGRRVLVIAAYWLAIFVLFALIPDKVSDACVSSSVCSPGEKLVLGLEGLALILGWGAAMVLGWMGRLPGARRRPVAPGGEPS